MVDRLDVHEAYTSPMDQAQLAMSVAKYLPREPLPPYGPDDLASIAEVTRLVMETALEHRDQPAMMWIQEVTSRLPETPATRHLIPSKAAEAGSLIDKGLLLTDEEWVEWLVARELKNEPKD